MSPPAPPSTSRPEEVFAGGLIVSLSWWLTLCFLLPAEVFWGNQSYLQLFFDDLLKFLLPVALGGAFATAGLLRLLPPGWRQRTMVLLLMATVLSWIHGYLLVWDHGIMDGKPIAWSEYRLETAVDLLLWLMGLGLAWWKWGAIYPHVRTGAIALLAMQAVSLFIAATNSYVSPLNFFKNYYVERTDPLDFSREQNVVVVLLDEFQSDVFADLMKARPDYADAFDGFTFFPNTVAGFSYTEFAVPAILTGRVYDNGSTREEFLREAYLQGSLPVALQTLGFETELYPWRGFANEAIYYSEEVASNFKRRPAPWQAKVGEVGRLLDVAWFRAAPQFAKPAVHRQGQGWAAELVSRWVPDPGSGENETPAEVDPFNSLDHDFIHLVTNPKTAPMPVTAGAAQPSFKFFHLSGLHVPVRMNRDFVLGEYDYTRANYTEFAEAFTRIMLGLVAELKTNDIYDQTMIVFVGDHGSGRAEEFWVNPSGSAEARALDSVAPGGVFQEDKARALPLLLIKPFGASGPLVINQAPASVVDITTTVVTALGGQEASRPAIDRHPEFVGESLLSMPVDRPRARYFGSMLWAGERSDYANPITLYRIEGHAWDDASWSMARQARAPEDDE